MTNNFTTIKENQASRKFFLVRLEPGRYVNDLLSSIGGGLYTYTFSGVISDVKANGVSLSKVTTVTNPGEWSHDETTGLFTIYETPSSTNAIVIYYYLFYTNERFRTTYQNPEDDTTTLRDWEPKILNAPKIEQSVENIIEGILSISSSTITFINYANEFQSYLTGDDSFYNKKITIWSCLDSVDNIQKVIESRITELSIDDVSFTINFEDNLSLLAQTATLGDDLDEMYHIKSSNPALDPSRNWQVIPFIIGRISPCKLVIDSTTSIEGFCLSFEELLEGSCIDYSDTISSTTNRLWGLCRSKDGFEDFSCTPSDITHGADYTRFTVTSGEAEKFFAGDTFVVANGGTDYYCRVLLVDRSNNYIYTNKNAALTTGDSIEGNDCPSVVIKLPDYPETPLYCLYGRDYTATTVATAGGNKYLKVTFENDFETNFAEFGANKLNPSTHKVLYRCRPSITNASHGKTVKFLLEQAGLTVNSTSITNADAALAANAIMVIPFKGSSYQNYYEYLQKIVSNAFGYIKLNNSFEVEYCLFQTPSATTELTDTEILEESFKTEIRYRDIVTKYSCSNESYAWELADYIGGISQQYKAKYLHDIDNVEKDSSYCLESFLTTDIQTRIDEIYSVRSERMATIRLETNIFNIDTEIGDEFLLSKTGLLGNDSTKSVVVIGTCKEINKTEVTLVDLYNL